MKSTIVDANVFLRFFVPDDKIKYKTALDFFHNSKKNKVNLVVPQIIVFEVNYSLLKFYHFEKEKIIKALASMFSADYLDIESIEIFTDALKIYQNNNLDLTDCFLAAKKNLENMDIFSFDEKLNKYAKQNI